MTTFVLRNKKIAVESLRAQVKLFSLGYMSLK